MHTKLFTILSRSVTALSLAAAISVGGAGIASASSHHDDAHGGNCASGRVSSFEYPNNGLGGYVTAATLTSVTVERWGGTSSTFAITPTTIVQVGTTTVGPSALVVGDRVQIQVASGDPSTAASITIELAMLFGVVSSVNGDTIAITDPQGFTRTILVGSATTFKKDGGPGALSDVVSGVKIIARGTIDVNGTTLDALSIDIGSAGTNKFVAGVVTGVTSSSVTILSRDGTSTTFTLTTTTLFKDGPLTLSLADLLVNERVGVEFNSSAVTTALRIDIQLAHLEGRVTGVSGNTITVSGPQGFARSIFVSTSTLYFQGRNPASLTDVVSGARVIALGTIDVDGSSLDALYVEIFPPAPSPPNPQGPVSGTVGGGDSDGGGGQFGSGPGHHHPR